MPPLRRTCRRKHAGLSLVRDRQSDARSADPDAFSVSEMRARVEARLVLLPLVLRSGFRSGNQPTLSRQTLPRTLCKQPLQKAVDGIHALLPVVPDKSEEAMEARGQPAQLPPLQMGPCQRLLEFLRVVQRTGAKPMMPGVCAAERLPCGNSLTYCSIVCVTAVVRMRSCRVVA